MLNGLWNRLINFRQKKAVILMYHQICEKKSDPWDLAVHPEKFASQLYYLKRNFNVVSIEELASAVTRKKLHRNMLAITFDDGFADNYTNAAPMLEWLQLPATFYVSTSAIHHNRPYWWDELQSIILQPELLPTKLSLKINGNNIQFQFRRDHILRGKVTQEIKCWRADMPVPNERVSLYLELWQHIKPLSYDHQNRTLEELRDWSKLTHVDNKHGAVMKVTDVQALSKNPLFTIGAHTVHHAMLAAQSKTDQAFEVQESKRTLENWTGKQVTGFAYPYGNYNGVTKSVLQEAGFKYAVSTESRVATVSDNLFELPRIQVKNWSVQQLTANINSLI